MEKKKEMRMKIQTEGRITESQKQELEKLKQNGDITKYKIEEFNPRIVELTRDELRDLIQQMNPEAHTIAFNVFEREDGHFVREIQGNAEFLKENEGAI